MFYCFPACRISGTVPFPLLFRRCRKDQDWHPVWPLCEPGHDGLRADSLGDWA